MFFSRDSPTLVKIFSFRQQAFPAPSIGIGERARFAFAVGRYGTLEDETDTAERPRLCPRLCAVCIFAVRLIFAVCLRRNVGLTFAVGLSCNIRLTFTDRLRRGGSLSRTACLSGGGSLSHVGSLSGNVGNSRRCGDRRASQQLRILRSPSLLRRLYPADIVPYMRGSSIVCDR